MRLSKLILWSCSESSWRDFSIWNDVQIATVATTSESWKQYWEFRPQKRSVRVRHSETCDFI